MFPPEGVGIPPDFAHSTVIFWDDMPELSMRGVCEAGVRGLCDR